MGEVDRGGGEEGVADVSAAEEGFDVFSDGCCSVEGGAV